MKELAQIRAAVLKALQESGIPAMEQFPEKRAESYSGAVATVGVGAASGKRRVLPLSGRDDRPGNAGGAGTVR